MYAYNILYECVCMYIGAQYSMKHFEPQTLAVDGQLLHSFHLNFTNLAIALHCVASLFHQR